MGDDYLPDLDPFTFSQELFRILLRVVRGDIAFGVFRIRFPVFV